MIFIKVYETWLIITGSIIFVNKYIIVFSNSITPKLYAYRICGIKFKMWKINAILNMLLKILRT